MTKNSDELVYAMVNLFDAFEYMFDQVWFTVKLCLWNNRVFSRVIKKTKLKMKVLLYGSLVSTL